MDAVRRCWSCRCVGTASSAEATVVDVVEAIGKLRGATTEVIPAMVEVCVTLVRQVTDIIGHAGAKTHAALVEGCTVQRRSAVIGDCAIKELITLTHALFADSASSVLPRREITVAVFLTSLIRDSFAIA